MPTLDNCHKGHIACSSVVFPINDTISCLHGWGRHGYLEALPHIKVVICKNQRYPTGKKYPSK